MYKIVFTKTATKDISKLKSAGLSNNAQKLIEVIKNDPYQTPPSYEKLCGNLQGLYARRINIKHRLVYEIYEDIKTIKIVSLWSHYER